jgi:hypothetical protein
MVLLGSPYLHHQKPVTHPQNIEGGTDRCQGHPFDEGITREIIVTDLDQGPQFQELVIDPQGESILQGEDLPLQGTILIIGPLEGDPGHHLVIGRLEWGCPVETYLLQVLAF